MPERTATPLALRPKVIEVQSRPLPNVDNLWLKLVSIFDDTCLHSKADAYGNFHFRGIPPGRYLLLVFSDTKLLHQREINVGYFDKDVLTITP